MTEPEILMSGQKNQDLKELATQLIAARSGRGLAPAQVAELMGVTSKYYAALERGTKQPSEMFLRFFLCSIRGER